MNGVIAWFRDGSNWTGSDGVPTLLLQHSLLTLTSVLIAMAIGLPLALWLGHLRRGGTLAVNISNVGRAIPIVALLALLSLGVLGTGILGPFGRAGLATLVTLALFALPPVITNAYTGVVEVDRDTVEAARGMGLTELDVLRRVELPLAMPLIVSGIRLAVVQVWATATVAALVAGPGLGRIITHGYDSNNGAEVIAGSLIVAVIALLLEGGMVFAQRALDPVARATR
ncbi:MAG: ABC transporter permease subunit [Actinomycetota bacterium]|nr:ABC transporter permease subunit [Actinomycetota bacterium]